MSQILLVDATDIHQQLSSLLDKTGHTVHLLPFEAVKEIVPKMDFVFMDSGRFQEKACERIAQIECAMNPSAILALHTVFFHVTTLAAAARNRCRVAGLRFAGKDAVSLHAELTRGLDTDEKTYQTLRSLVTSMGTYIVDAPDITGGVYLRMMAAELNMAVSMVAEGMEPVDIDTGIRYGLGAKTGSLHLADDFGLDNLLLLLEQLYDESGDSAFKPHSYLRKLVGEGAVGRKSGQGFFTY